MSMLNFFVYNKTSLIDSYQLPATQALCGLENTKLTYNGPFLSIENSPGDMVFGFLLKKETYKDFRLRVAHPYVLTKTKISLFNGEYIDGSTSYIPVELPYTEFMYTKDELAFYEKHDLPTDNLKKLNSVYEVIGKLA